MLSADPEDATDPALSYNQRSNGNTAPRRFVDGDGRWDCRGQDLPLGRLGYDTDIANACGVPGERASVLYHWGLSARFGRPRYANNLTVMTVFLFDHNIPAIILAYHHSALAHLNNNSLRPCRQPRERLKNASGTPCPIKTEQLLLTHSRPRESSQYFEFR